jgi:beta-lactamase regulating signal transducer with metallopeptidase domain
VPKIGAVLVLIGLILLGVAVIALASVVVLRPRKAGKARKVGDLYPEGSERAVYERLYGKRSMTVSAPVPVKRPPEAGVDSPQAGLRE